ncbi:hypothetical protein [Cohnella cellulosilytica]
MDEKILFDDIIDLTPKQIALILKESPKKTQKQWFSEDSKGIKIPLSDKQRTDVLNHRKKLVSGQTKEQLVANKRVRLTEHFIRRVALRIDGSKAFPSKESLYGMIEIAINSKKLAKNAEWKGYGGLSYNFKGAHRGEECTVSVTFENQMILITVFTKEPTPQTTQLGNHISAEKLAQIRAIATQHRKLLGNGKSKNKPQP